MATAFSSADAAVITHEVALDAHAVEATAAYTHQRVEDVYSVRETAHDLVFYPHTHDRITPRLERVALQFPDEALVDSVPLYHALQDALQMLTDTPPKLYILADTSYGSCCVDEVAAAHVQADALVHYGHACLSPTASLPALYVFPRHALDVQQAAQGLLDATARLALDTVSAVVVAYDVAYAYCIHDVFAAMQAVWTHAAPLVLTQIDASTHYKTQLAHRGERRTPTLPTALRTSVLGGGRRVALPEGVDLASTAAVYLGSESKALTHLLLALGSQHPVASFDPVARQAKEETGTTNRLLMRRYATIQKARDASVVGLVIGTLGVQAYLPLVKELRRVLTSPVSQRKVYTISVGKLNPAKLANFQEIDAFVLIACPENSMLDAKEFFRPIVTPWEMLLAVRAHSGNEVPWTGAYLLDLADAVDDAKEIATETPLDDEQPHYSFATGTYVARTRYGDTSAPDVDAAGQQLERMDVAPHQLTVRDASGRMVKVLESAALPHHQQRTWVGLDRDEGAARPAALLEQGMQGFAQHYESAEGHTEGAAIGLIP